MFQRTTPHVLPRKYPGRHPRAPGASAEPAELARHRDELYRAFEYDTVSR